jgi:hypothetical protein
VVVGMGFYNCFLQHSTDTSGFEHLVWSQSINLVVYVLIIVLNFLTNILLCVTLDIYIYVCLCLVMYHDHYEINLYWPCVVMS